MEQKNGIMYRRVKEKARENVEITCQTAMRDFEKVSINSFMFCYPSTPLTGFFFTTADVYGTVFTKGRNQHYTKIMKQRGQSLKSFRLLHLLTKIILFERKKHCKNIYASLGRSESLFPIRIWNKSERTENGINRTNNKVKG
ncbi:hypothetical protein HZS_1513 [Henneguya salminicola]|nr:hypothetical protein HZS_1513 [Henneguya salminicola]